MAYTLGIDFGTSTTKVALRRGNEIPQPLPIGQAGAFFMPSVVAYRRNKSDRAEVYAVGEDALKEQREDTMVVHEVKRVLVDAESEIPDLPAERYPWWNHQSRRVKLWSDELLPHDVVLTILTEALKRAVHQARELGFGSELGSFNIRGLPTRLGCSVTSGLETRRVLADIARRLGFPQFTAQSLHEEPILASLAYIHQQASPDDTILVYDLGGGTFDTAVVKVREKSSAGHPALTVLAADGEPFCGGASIDKDFFEYMVDRISEKLGEEPALIRDGMTSQESHTLWNYAREAKEILSEAEETTIALPPGFLGRAKISLRVTRSELEAVVNRGGLIEKTGRCVRRCWRRARMLLRDPNEAAGKFSLQHEPSSGRLSGSVLSLGDSDIRDRVTKVLLVGGSTRMPLIRRTLSELWGEGKFVREEVVKPVEACCVGAAWQQESLGSIVDRLPFSIAVQYDGGRSVMYRAYTPTVTYRTLTSSPCILPFESSPFSVTKGDEEVSILYEDTDGQTEVVRVLTESTPGSYSLRIDMFGRCILAAPLGTFHELPNPYQHPMQLKLWHRLDEEREKKAREEKERLKRYLKRLPGQEYDVG